VTRSTIPIKSETDTIMAIDPGKVTGIAVYQLCNPGHVFTQETDVDDTVRVYQRVRRLVGARHLTVVMEQFTIGERTIRTAPSLDALDIIGYVKLHATAGIDDNHSLYMQMPSNRKFGLDKLDALGWGTNTKDNHANDAAAHLLAHLAAQHPGHFRDHLLPLIRGEQ
jgi:hypothetical protein